jgi:UDP-glucose 4-epimerase
MVKALVTGGAGFIGSWVTDKLIARGLEVTIIDDLSTGDKKNLNPKAKFYEIDIRDQNISKVFTDEKPDYVFHLAAQINLRISMEDPITDLDINIKGSVNLLKNCAEHKVKKVIFSSTGGAIYGDGVTIPTPETAQQLPPSPYGIGKQTIENYLRFYKNKFGLDSTILRYANVYGPRQNSSGEAGVVSIFVNNILNETPSMINGSGEQTRDYVYVKDVADANILALDLHGTFNVGTGIETNVNELYKQISNEMGISMPAQHRESITGEQMKSCLDATLLKENGWAPRYNLLEGLKETIEYFRNQQVSL